MDLRLKPTKPTGLMGMIFPKQCKDLFLLISFFITKEQIFNEGAGEFIETK